MIEVGACHQKGWEAFQGPGEGVGNPAAGLQVAFPDDDWDDAEVGQRALEKGELDLNGVLSPDLRPLARDPLKDPMSGQAGPDQVSTLRDDSIGEPDVHRNHAQRRAIAFPGVHVSPFQGLPVGRSKNDHHIVGSAAELAIGHTRSRARIGVSRVGGNQRHDSPLHVERRGPFQEPINLSAQFLRVLGIEGPGYCRGPDRAGFRTRGSGLCVHCAQGHGQERQAHGETTSQRHGRVCRAAISVLHLTISLSDLAIRSQGLKGRNDKVLPNQN